MPEEGRPSVSLIVRAFNEEAHIAKLLAGVMEQSLPPGEIILVDSGSTDATLAVAAHFQPRVVNIRPEDFTFGRSLNMGCRAATGDILVIASAHVFPVYPDWLESLVAAFEDPQVALAYGRQRGDSPTYFSESQIFAKLYPAESNLHQTQPFCNNANAAIRRSLWLERPYDEELPGLEDLDWAVWATANGHRIAYVAEAEVVHLHHEGPSQVYNRYRREAIGLKRIRPTESFHVWDFARLLISNVISDLRHAWAEGSALSVAGQIVWFRWAQFWGTYRGFAYQGGLTPNLKQAFYYPRDFGQAAKGTLSRTIEPIDYTEAMQEHGSEHAARQTD
jgi:rhamnosyltransferase